MKARKKHENIIDFYGVCNQPGNFSLVIELAPYGSLYNFLQMPEAAKMGFNDLIKWSLDITNGVQGRIIKYLPHQGFADGPFWTP